MFKWLSIAAIIFIADQATKILALQQLILHSAVAIMPGLNLELAYNEGAAFSMLAESSGWQQTLFIVAGVIISLAIVVWLKFLSRSQQAEGWALTFILGGALGNLLDRVRFGYVVDFIDVYYGSWHWYTFNVADTFISVGTFLLLWTALIGRS